MQHHQILGAGAPGAPQCRVPASGTEQRGIHAPADDPDAPEAPSLEVFGQCRCRRERAPGTPVKAAQPGGGRGREPAEAVVSRVVLEIGVKACHHRDRQPGSRRRSGGAERALGRHIDDVGSLLPPATREPGRQNKTHPQPRIEGDAERGGQRLAGIFGLVLVRSWTDHGDRVTAGPQPARETGHGHGDAVDLGRPCLTDQGDVQAPGMLAIHGSDTRLVR